MHSVFRTTFCDSESKKRTEENPAISWKFTVVSTSVVQQYSVWQTFYTMLTQYATGYAHKVARRQSYKNSFCM